MITDSAGEMWQMMFFQVCTSAKKERRGDQGGEHLKKGEIKTRQSSWNPHIKLGKVSGRLICFINSRLEEKISSGKKLIYKIGNIFSTL